jgi:hypothetical protein
MEKVQVVEVFTPKPMTTKAGKPYHIVDFKDGYTGRKLTVFAWQQADIPLVGDILEGDVETRQNGQYTNYTFHKGGKKAPSASTSQGSVSGGVSAEWASLIVAGNLLTAQAAAGKVSVNDVTFDRLAELASKIKDKVNQMEANTAQQAPVQQAPVSQPASVGQVQTAPLQTTSEVQATPAMQPPVAPPVIPEHITNSVVEGAEDIPF